MKRFQYPCFIVILAAAAALILACAAGTTATKTGWDDGPKVTIAPVSGKPAAKITIYGTGFKPGEEIDIVMLIAPGEKVGLGTEKVDVIKVNPYGAFTAQSAIYVRARPGVYAVEVSGSMGSEATARVTVLPK
jgi:hypothetical protein